MNGRTAAWTIGLLLWPATTLADPCESELGEAGAPVRAPLGPADFGMLPEACAANSVSLRAHLGLLIATDDYYGQVHVGASVLGRFELPGGSWVSAQLPGLDYRLAVNATVEAEHLGLGASTLSWHVPLPITEQLQLAPYVRAMLPTESVYESGLRYGFEHGIAGVVNVHPMFELVGGYSLPLLLTSSYGTVHSVTMPTVALDAGFRPWSWFEVLGGVAVRVVPPDEEPFESFDPRASLRFYPWRGLYVDVAGAFPLLGRDRTNAAASLTAGWLFDR